METHSNVRGGLYRRQDSHLDGTKGEDEERRMAAGKMTDKSTCWGTRGVKIYKTTEEELGEVNFSYVLSAIQQIGRNKLRFLVAVEFAQSVLVVGWAMIWRGLWVTWMRVCSAVCAETCWNALSRLPVSTPTAAPASAAGCSITTPVLKTDSRWTWAASNPSTGLSAPLVTHHFLTTNHKSECFDVQVHAQWPEPPADPLCECRAGMWGGLLPGESPHTRGWVRVCLHLLL